MNTQIKAQSLRKIVHTHKEILKAAQHFESEFASDIIKCISNIQYYWHQYKLRKEADNNDDKFFEILDEYIESTMERLDQFPVIYSDPKLSKIIKTNCIEAKSESGKLFTSAFFDKLETFIGSSEYDIVYLKDYGFSHSAYLVYEIMYKLLGLASTAIKSVKNHKILKNDNVTAILAEENNLSDYLVFLNPKFNRIAINYMPMDIIKTGEAFRHTGSLFILLYKNNISDICLNDPSPIIDETTRCKQEAIQAFIKKVNRNDNSNHITYQALKKFCIENLLSHSNIKFDDTYKRVVDRLCPGVYADDRYKHKLLTAQDIFIVGILKS